MTTQTDFSANYAEIDNFINKETKTPEEEAVMESCKDIFDGDEEAFKAWLFAENALLGNRRPLEIIESGNQAEIQTVADCISGVDRGCFI